MNSGMEGNLFLNYLERENIKASFFLTGNFYRNKEFRPVITELLKNGNYHGLPFRQASSLL